MFSIEHVDPNRPPKPTKFIERRIMCGACNFKCCNGKSLNVECTPEEAKTLGLPVLFAQEGRCRCLTDAGCAHGEDRPVFCKLFPLQIKPANKPTGSPSLIVSYWSILNCPVTTDYVFEHEADGKYHYRRKDVGGAKRNNSPEVLVLDQPIEKEFPEAVQANGEAVDALYGEGTAANLKNKLNGPPGFGFTGGE